MNFTQRGGASEAKHNHKRLFKKYFVWLFSKRSAFSLSFLSKNAFQIRNRANGFTLAEVFSPLSGGKHTPAFTLAEVLITLGIIGIVAAMTLPALVNDKQNKELQTQFKKTYSELNQVARLFYNDNGISVSEYTADGNFNKFLSQLPQYMKGIKSTNGWTFNDIDEETGSEADTMPYYIYPIKGNSNVKSHCDVTGFRSDISGRVYSFNDAPRAGYNGPTICVDINGQKRPNRYGIDIFLFVFTTDGFVIPMGQENKNNYTQTSNGGNQAFVPSEDYCKYNESQKSQYACASFALADKNPEGEGNYWNDFLKNIK